MSKMNSKDKDNKTLHDKLKQFFRINKGKRITFRTSHMSQVLRSIYLIDRIDRLCRKLQESRGIHFDLRYRKRNQS